MAIDDNTLYGLTGAQVKELPGKIEAVKGKAKILTTDDYDYPNANPTGIALWRLEPGLYIVSEGITAYYSVYFNNPQIAYGGLYLIAIDNNGTNTNILYFSNAGVPRFARAARANGERLVAFDYFVPVVDDLTSSRVNAALSANQGKVLKGLIDSIAIRGAGAPTTSTVGQVGTLYEDTTNGDLYICTDATNPYVWEEVGASGGGGPTVVQTTGTSTTDVMSQNAVTSMVYADPSTKFRVQIGATSNAGGGGSVAIGYAANSSLGDSVSIGARAVAVANGATAIGYGAQATTQGQFDIGLSSLTSPVNYGYNNSQYRLLTGLYDPQSAHDAATKGYVDTAVAGAGAATFTTNEWNALWA